MKKNLSFAFFLLPVIPRFSENHPAWDKTIHNVRLITKRTFFYIRIKNFLQSNAELSVQNIDSGTENITVPNTVVCSDNIHHKKYRKKKSNTIISPNNYIIKDITCLHFLQIANNKRSRYIGKITTFPQVSMVLAANIDKEVTHLNLSLKNIHNNYYNTAFPYKTCFSDISILKRYALDSSGANLLFPVSKKNPNMIQQYSVKNCFYYHTNALSETKKKLKRSVHLKSNNFGNTYHSFFIGDYREVLCYNKDKVNTNQQHKIRIELIRQNILSELPKGLKIKTLYSYKLLEKYIEKKEKPAKRKIDYKNSIMPADTTDKVEIFCSGKSLNIF